MDRGQILEVESGNFLNSARDELSRIEVRTVVVSEGRDYAEAKCDLRPTGK